MKDIFKAAAALKEIIQGRFNHPGVADFAISYFKDSLSLKTYRSQDVEDIVQNAYLNFLLELPKKANSIKEIKDIEFLARNSLRAETIKISRRRKSTRIPDEVSFSQIECFNEELISCDSDSDMFAMTYVQARSVIEHPDYEIKRKKDIYEARKEREGSRVSRERDLFVTESILGPDRPPIRNGICLDPSGQDSNSASGSLNSGSSQHSFKSFKVPFYAKAIELRIIPDPALSFALLYARVEKNQQMSLYEWSLLFNCPESTIKRILMLMKDKEARKAYSAPYWVKNKNIRTCMFILRAGERMFNPSSYYSNLKSLKEARSRENIYTVRKMLVR